MRVGVPFPSSFPIFSDWCLGERSYYLIPQRYTVHALLVTKDTPFCARGTWAAVPEFSPQNSRGCSCRLKNMSYSQENALSAFLSDHCTNSLDWLLSFAVCYNVISLEGSSLSLLSCLVALKCVLDGAGVCRSLSHLQVQCVLVQRPHRLHLPLPSLSPCISSLANASSPRRGPALHVLPSFHSRLITTSFGA